MCEQPTLRYSLRAPSAHSSHRFLLVIRLFAEEDHVDAEPGISVTFLGTTAFGSRLKHPLELLLRGEQLEIGERGRTEGSRLTLGSPGVQCVGGPIHGEGGNARIWKSCLGIVHREG